MPIDKPEGSGSFLNKAGFGFTILDNEAFKAVGCATAIGVWAYLCSKPQAWKVVDKEVCQSLGIGRDKYRKAMARLRNAGLVWDDYTRVKGVIMAKQISVTWTLSHAKGSHTNHMPDNQSYGTDGHHMPEKPTVGENLLKVNQAVLVKKEETEKKETTEILLSEKDSDEPREEVFKVTKARIPYADIVEAYHELLPDLSAVRKMTETRRRQIKKLWNDGSLPDLDNWRNFFDYVSQSDFLMGRGQTNGRQWRADLEWITKPANYVKILEERYHGG